jgi:hypothetical protein
MTARAAVLSLAFLAGCATEARDPAPVAPATPGAAPHAVQTARPASAGASDWALAILGTPFVFAFRVVACTATAVVAAPTAGLLVLAPDPGPGLAYLRDGLGQNCSPPYGMPVPVAAGYRAEPDIGYYAERAIDYYPAPGMSYYSAPGARYYPAPGARSHPAPDILVHPAPGVGAPRPLTPYRGPAAMAP